jgi:hypothetical protein
MTVQKDSLVVSQAYAQAWVFVFVSGALGLPPCIALCGIQPINDFMDVHEIPPSKRHDRAAPNPFIKSKLAVL